MSIYKLSGSQEANTTSITTETQEAIKYFTYDPETEIITASKALETTLNSLYLGEQHKMSSGSENIYFTNLSSDINYFPMWGGLKDQSVAANRDSTGFIPPSGRVYSDMFSLPLGGLPASGTSVGYAGDNYFGINITGVGITTVAAEDVPSTVKLQYRITINGVQVYMQTLPRGVSTRSTAGVSISAGDVIEWFFDHPVDVAAGTTLHAEIHKVNKEDDVDLGVFQVRQGDTVDPNTGLLRYQATVHNRLFEDKDLELISPYLKYQAMDFKIDATGSNIALRDLSLGADSTLVSHSVNTLEALANGTNIQIKLKDGQKVLIESLPVSGASVNGAYVNSVLNSAVLELNALFTNTAGFASAGGNPVISFVLSGNNLTLGLQDGTSYTVDVTTLGVDENNFVSSGAVSGSDLVLTMSDASTVTIDASNMINGSSGLATNSSWFISYGTNANDAVGTSVNDSTVNTQLPFYFGEALTRGSEFKWNFQSNGGYNLILGIWDGAETPLAYNAGSITASNWGTMFNYAAGFTAGSNSTLLATNSGAKYVVSNGDAMGIRFGNDGHLTLVDYSGTNEVAVAKTTIPLAVDSFNMQMHTWSGGVFPNGIINNVDYIWDIVHDYANVEAGILNGILDHTIIKSAISIEIGEKIMFMLDEVGRGDYFGTNYTNASTGVATAEEQLDNQFIYQTNEALVFTIGGANDWNVNTNASGYFFAANLDQYRDGGGSGTVQGMFSLRFNTDGKLTIYDEDSGVKVATAKNDPVVGSSVHLYFGVKGNRAYSSIPVISKQAIGSGSQPNTNFAPTVSDQTVTVTESSTLNYTIVDSDNIVNQYVEVDAPSWMVMNQTTGVLSGTAPAFSGSAADTVVVNCKAGNSVGGIVSFTVTVTVAANTSYTNSNSLSFNGTSSFVQGNATLMNAMDRVSNGDGSAWSLSMWIKPSSTTSTGTLFNYGGNASLGAITLHQTGGNNLTLQYGTAYNKIVIASLGCLTVGSWNHLLISFDGGTTGVNQADLSNYYSRFSIAVDGVFVTQYGSHNNYGYSGALNGNNVSDNIFRIGRDSNVYNNYSDAVINQVGIWGSDQSANLATIYNSGVTQDLSLLATAPAHYYEIGSSVTTVTDLVGSADLTGYNFVASDLVTDTP